MKDGIIEIRGYMYSFFPIIFNLKKDTAYIPIDDWQYRYFKWVLHVIGFFGCHRWNEASSISFRGYIPDDDYRNLIRICDKIAV